MNDQALAKACNTLNISDVWQESVSAFVDESLRTAASFPEDHDVLFKHLVSESMWGLIENGDERQYVFRVFVALGVRFTTNETPSESDEPDILAQIEATYVAEYFSEEDPGEEARREFASRNASFHVWPFWREFLASQCNRMNLPKAALPLHNFGVPTTGFSEASDSNVIDGADSKR
jgi:hypothetical protein